MQKQLPSSASDCVTNLIDADERLLREICLLIVAHQPCPTLPSPPNKQLEQNLPVRKLAGWTKTILDLQIAYLMSFVMFWQQSITDLHKAMQWQQCVTGSYVNMAWNRYIRHIYLMCMLLCIHHDTKVLETLHSIFYLESGSPIE